SGQLPARLRERRALRLPPGIPAGAARPAAPPPGGWPTDPRLDPFLAEPALARAEAVLGRPPGIAPEDTRPGISVVILTLDRPGLIGPLLRALVAARPALRERALGLQILVGDTGSTDPAVLALYRDLAGEIELVPGLRYHFSRNNNQLCFDHARHDHVLFLNNDVAFDDAAASLLAMHAGIAATPRAAAAGHVLHFGDGVTLQHGGIGFLQDPARRGLPYHPRAHRAVPSAAFAPAAPAAAVTGACLMVARREFAALGGFEEGYAAECQDVDLCLKLRRIGRKVVLIGGPRALHLENATRPRREEHWGDRSLFLRRWFSFLAAEGALGA
ncbi:glycosyltransferase, partial [Dankookia rubra]